ncbi:3-hydroxyacyl-CoA dehydrogenase family protein [Agathobaculum sp.]|uniref:3-hydroxyacyl-CoA dehydrogenase family protein n=1 Tax=Agathobaculum sp. TaxID=2048138 RepID=UPI002A7FF946|nr:3-hydroxyacyl-CoA dehydrogenase family protein [Agathobaculum sp.]MDY3619508.1 3-hydroxyacyl-CoA dehydrogenase family protein [Agathobaculum sp.]
MTTEKQKIAVIGTGMMGMSLAALFTGNGYHTTVLATKTSSAERGKRSYDDMYAVLKSRGLMTDAQAEACEKNLHFTLSYDDLKDVDAIFECALEDKAVKFAIYEQIEKHCEKFRVIASTTSAMAPETLCEGLKREPGKLVVAHPFNPPHLVPFVEMVKCACTDDAAAQAAYDILESCGRKVCVMKKSAPGFIANRLQHALLREAIYMVEQGLADPRDIDKALMYSFMPRYTSVGLFEHQDAAGLDMVQNIEDYLLRDLSDAKEAPAFVRERVARGDLGQKTGQGTYAWDDAAKADFKARAAEPYWQYFNWNLPQA